MSDQRKTVLRLRDAPPKDPEYIFNDVQRALKVLSDAGFVATYRAVREAWEQYSADDCAGWLSFPPPGASGDKFIVETLLKGKHPVELTLNGRKHGPYLVVASTGETAAGYEWDASDYEAAERLRREDEDDNKDDNKDGGE